MLSNPIPKCPLIPLLWVLSFKCAIVVHLSGGDDLGVVDRIPVLIDRQGKVLDKSGISFLSSGQDGRDAGRDGSGADVARPEPHEGLKNSFLMGQHRSLFHLFLSFINRVQNRKIQ